MKKIFPIDKTLNKIFDEAEEEFKEYGVNRDQIKDIFYLFWYNVKQILKSNKYPTLVFPKWGRFVPGIGNLKKLARRYEKQGKTEDHQNILSVIDRLNNENKKRKRDEY